MTRHDYQHPNTWFHEPEITFVIDVLIRASLQRACPSVAEDNADDKLSVPPDVLSHQHR